MLHLGARLHAFVHGLFRRSDLTETQVLHEAVRSRFVALGVDAETGRADLAAYLSDELRASLGIPVDTEQAGVVERFVSRLFEYEGLFVLPSVDWSRQRSVSELWEMRDGLKRQRDLVRDFDGIKEALLDGFYALLAPLYEDNALLREGEADTDVISVKTDLVYSLGDVASVTEAAWQAGVQEPADEVDLFPRLRSLLIGNLIEASGGNRYDPRAFTKTPKLPRKSDIKEPRELVAAYLGNTPIHDLFDQTIAFAIPTRSRFEHHHIVAGSGHGKTQTLQFLIASDLEAVADGARTVIVLDSQGDLIRNISQLAEFAPGGSLHERVVIIDPTDVEWPVSLNLFDVGVERLAGYAPLERERLTNSILELYDFVLGSLLAAEMTQKQSVIFRYVTRLMLHIPDATIHTLRELMEKSSEIKFAEHIAKLEGTARHFFETEFSSKEFEQTKKQVLRRLWGILENQTFERMFSHPRSKLDLFAEMNEGKVILINTAKDLLKEHGTEIFGRFFIAMIAQAAQERATIPERERTPTIVYIDEAADYFDRTISTILAQARKYNVGMVLAHQYMGQLDPKLQEAVSANTSIKFAGGVSAKDARTLAPMLYTDSALIESQPKGSFAAYVRGLTPRALPLQFPLGYLEGKERMSPADREVLQDRMRERYAVHYTTLRTAHKEEDGPLDAKDDPEPESPPSGPDEVDTTAGTEW